MWKFLKYRFNKAFEQNLFNLVLFLIGISVVGILFFSTLFFLLQKIGLLGEDNFFTATVWQAFNLFFDQNAKARLLCHCFVFPHDNTSSRTTRIENYSKTEL